MSLSKISEGRKITAYVQDCHIEISIGIDTQAQDDGLGQNMRKNPSARLLIPIYV